MESDTLFEYLSSDLIVINKLRVSGGSLILSSDHLRRLYNWTAIDAKVEVDKYLRSVGVKE